MEDICKALDFAIMKQEIGGNTSLAGYKVSEKEPYGNYLSNDCWEKVKEDMKKNHPKAFEAYGKGGGKELEVRKEKGHLYPPKMASFGSSSRMIYNLMKDYHKSMKCCCEFEFEKKLPTVIGGTANLDGFFENCEKRVFVEAKCREPYSAKSSLVSTEYETLYKFLSDSECNNLKCASRKVQVKIRGKVREMLRVDFSADETPLKHFDIKQMICHLLGIANDCLKKKDDKKIKFIYLLYNPTKLKFDDLECEKKILSIYDLECKECDALNFNGLFSDILKFLREKDDPTDVESIARNFSFERLDQDNMTL